MTDEEMREYSRLVSIEDCKAYGVVGCARCIISMYNAFPKGTYSFEQAIKSLSECVAKFELASHEAEKFYEEHKTKEQEVA